MKTDWKRLKVSVWQNKQVYLMMLPVLVVLLLFSYYPMYGLVLAFKEYQPAQGIFGSEWASSILWTYSHCRILPVRSVTPSSSAH